MKQLITLMQLTDANTGNVNTLTLTYLLQYNWVLNTSSLHCIEVVLQSESKTKLVGRRNGWTKVTEVNATDFHKLITSLVISNASCRQKIVKTKDYNKALKTKAGF